MEYQGTLIYQDALLLNLSHFTSSKGFTYLSNEIFSVSIYVVDMGDVSLAATASWEGARNDMSGGWGRTRMVSVNTWWAS